MQIRKATGDEMLKLWGYSDAEQASPTARYFYKHICCGNAVFWTIEYNNDLIGELYVFLDIEEDRDFADGYGTAYLCAFRIKDGFRGQGFGSRLIDAALSDLRSVGFSRATIGVDDERNEHLYRRLGFTRKVKDCFSDPCARDRQMRPEPVPAGFTLLAKEL